MLKSQVNFCQNTEAPYKQKTAWKILQPNICYSDIIQSGSSIHFLSLWAWVGEVLNSIQFYLLGCDHSVRHAVWEKGESFQISQDSLPHTILLLYSLLSLWDPYDFARVHVTLWHAVSSSRSLGIILGYQEC